MYQSLYKKYRPRIFDQIYGQEKVVEILKNQILKDQLGHAYLFTGVRGTGKTSIAKIMAQAINCENSQKGNPCNECKICKSTLSGNNVDVIEMDAASNNGVDDIRMIKDEISFLPTTSKYRVYIIDEVHMLSTGAFNALLKTLEEPPSHVKFILATTEPHKLPATIISRCQRFEFTRITETKIAELLSKISKETNIDIEENAINLIAILAKGSARDGISILESVSNLKNKINVKDVRRIVGIPDTKEIIKLFIKILKNETTEVVNIVNKLLDEGKEPINILTELISVISASYLESENLVSIYELNEKEIIKQLFKIDKIELYKILKELLKLVSEIKYIENKKIMIISTLIDISEKNKENKYLEKTINSIPNVKNIEEKLEIENIQDIEEIVEIKEIIAEETKEIENIEKDEITETIEKEELVVEKENNEIIIENQEPKILKENTEKNIKQDDIEPSIILEKEESKKQESEKEIIKNVSENVNENINLEKNEKKTFKNIDTLTFRKKFLMQKNPKMFVALSNVKLILENEKTLIVDLTNEKNLENIELLNSDDALLEIKNVAKEILNMDIDVKYNI